MISRPVQSITRCLRTVASVISDKNKRGPQDALPSRPIYLDGLATTPLDPRVMDKMAPYSVSYYGNPHSSSHAYGWHADEAIETSRQQVADIIGASDKSEIIFTSGATESNNIAVKGVSRFYTKKKHIIVSQIEHKCVLDSARHLEHSEGFEVTYLPVNQNGQVDINELEEAIRPGQTLLVSIMAVNNELGTIQPVKEIGALCRKNKVFFHCDAAQAVGKIPIDVNEMNIDLLSLSGHKIYGPKGVGALYVRKRPRVRMDALFSGGGQERGFRSGTLATPLVVGLGAACELAQSEMEYDHQYMKELSERLIKGIEECEHTTFNGHREERVPGCANMSFAAVEGEGLLIKLNSIALSSGSACTSASLEPSYVLRAIGQSEDLAHSSLRFGINRFTTVEEVDYTVELVKKVVEELREMSPLWDMLQDGIDMSEIDWHPTAHQAESLK